MIWCGESVCPSKTPKLDTLWPETKCVTTALVGTITTQTETGAYRISKAKA
jgi:hypothetical protein